MSDDRQVFSVSPAGDGRGLVLVGELDAATAPDLVDVLPASNGDPNVTLDLSGLTFIDSSGLHAIVRYARSREPDGVVTLTGLAPNVRRLFEITGLTELSSLRIDGRG